MTPGFDEGIEFCDDSCGFAGPGVVGLIADGGENRVVQFERRGHEVFDSCTRRETRELHEYLVHIAADGPCYG